MPIGKADAGSSGTQTRRDRLGCGRGGSRGRAIGEHSRSLDCVHSHEVFQRRRRVILDQLQPDVSGLADLDTLHHPGDEDFSVVTAAYAARRPGRLSSGM